MSHFWHATFGLTYRILALIDPLVRAVWRPYGIGNVVELEVPRRRGGGNRSRLVGLLRLGTVWYVGHPDGEVGWTRDLQAAGGGIVRWHDGTVSHFTARRLPVGEERERAVRATSQHPFPGNLVYRLGRRQVRAAGIFFRLEDEPASSTGVESSQA